ncbi:hypothetical protein AB0J35_15330 [Nonomuraea angiospora]|uniref:hypothetical protein n=1 Tax=Nonomuraea angiospora TaxID=46172 RepID=UPI003427A084
MPGSTAIGGRYRLVTCLGGGAATAVIRGQPGPGSDVFSLGPTRYAPAAAPGSRQRGAGRRRRPTSTEEADR